MGSGGSCILVDGGLIEVSTRGVESSLGGVAQGWKLTDGAGVIQATEGLLIGESLLHTECQCLSGPHGVSGCHRVSEGTEGAGRELGLYQAQGSSQGRNWRGCSHLIINPTL